MSGTVEGAVRRWTEAAALLTRMGRAPISALTWLGPSWSGAAARAYGDWASAFDQASGRAARALRAAAESAQALAETSPRRCVGADLDAVRAGLRAITEVRMPGQRNPEPQRRPAPVEPKRPSPRHSQARPDKHSSHGPRPAGRSGSVPDWIRQATAILREHGYRAEQMDPDAIATIIEHESSGNPAAVNDWDSNAAKGIPSTGLMQTIPPTFEQWHLPGHDQILDPVDNIIAGVRYAIARYGSVSRVPGVVSLAAGEGYRGY